jgi:hypothetical protein
MCLRPAMDTAPDLRNVAVRLTLEGQDLVNLLRRGRRDEARALAQRTVPDQRLGGAPAFGVRLPVRWREPGRPSTAIPPVPGPHSCDLAFLADRAQAIADELDEE